MALATLSRPSAKAQDYKNLRRTVSETLIEGRRRIEALKVQTYWQTGRLIRTYINAHPEESQHGKGVIDRLSDDLNIERTLLYRVLRFSDDFPNVATSQHLTWSHYRELLALPDGSQRKQLAREAIHQEWPVRRLQREVRKRVKKGKSNQIARGPTLVEPERGYEGIRRVWTLSRHRGKNRKVIDLGFNIYRALTSEEIGAPRRKDGGKAGRASLQPGDVVQWKEAKRKWVHARDADSIYFYTGDVERVVDGDTLLVHIDLGFGTTKRQYLRLRGINASELSTESGVRARHFLLRAFRKSSSVQFKSRSRDPYGRYLSDVWKGNCYLNQALLTAGLAEPA
jgi:endonuclease YncB( thermonuclease family)